MMKKIVVVPLILALVLLAACGQAKNKTEPTPARVIERVEDIETLGDAFALSGAEPVCSGSWNDRFAYAFLFNDIYYRALATLTKEQAESYYAFDYSLEGAEEAARELIKDAKVDIVENLSDMIPSQETLDALIGKTGEDLLNDGWWGSFYDFDTWNVAMNQGIFTFMVTFDPAESEVPEDYIADEVIKPLIVTAVVFSEIGDVSADLAPQE